METAVVYRCLCTDDQVWMLQAMTEKLGQVLYVREWRRGKSTIDVSKEEQSLDDNREESQQRNGRRKDSDHQSIVLTERSWKRLCMFEQGAATQACRCSCTG